MKKIYALAILLVLGFVLLTACDAVIDESIDETNDEITLVEYVRTNNDLLPLVHDDGLLRLRLELPSEWEGRYSIVPIDWPASMTAEDRTGREGIDVRTSWGGLLFQIFKHPTSTWGGIENLPPVRNEIILETEDSVFVMTWPSDVQWRDSNEEAVHSQMTEEIGNIRFSAIERTTSGTDESTDTGFPLETEALVGFIEIHGNTLYIAPVEVFLIYDGSDVDLFTDTFWRSVVFIERNDIQKMDEFGLNAEHDFPSGNHIRPNWHCAERANIDILSFEITEETEFFVRGINSVLDDILPNLYPSVVHFIEVHDSRVVRLVQEFKFTM